MQTRSWKRNDQERGVSHRWSMFVVSSDPPTTNMHNGPRPPERRAPSRLPDPTCPECSSTDVRVTLRVVWAVYYRCEACEHLWAVQKPQRV